MIPVTKEIEPQKRKYHKFYQELAEVAATQSVAVRRKVGAVLVLPTGLISTGWNGTKPGADNCCEYECEKTNHKYLPNLETKPDVIHAEKNALNKLTEQGISAEGSILFVTTAPCSNCAEALIEAGIKEVHFRDLQSSHYGIALLKTSKVHVYTYTNRRIL